MKGEIKVNKPKIIKLHNGEKGNVIKITSLNLEGVMRRRLLDLGFVPGAIVEVIRKSPLGDPIAFRVSQTMIALRKEESSKIEGELVTNG
jgi:ferrous iron transport protein A